MSRLFSFGFLALVISFLAGSSKPGENYVGSWSNENPHAYFPAIQIEPNGKSFLVTIDVLGGNPLESKYEAAQFSAVYDDKNDVLVVSDRASGTFTITYNQKTGQLFSDLSSSFGTQNFTKNTATHGEEFLGTWVSQSGNINIKEFTVRRQGEGFVVFTNYYNDVLDVSAPADFVATYQEGKGGDKLVAAKEKLVFPERNDAELSFDRNSGELISTLTGNDNYYIRANK